MSRRNKTPRVVERKLKGAALGYAYSDGLIEIDPRQPPREYLDTLVHESLHLAFPEMEEAEIDKNARFITAILWRQNYRKVSQ